MSFRWCLALILLCAGLEAHPLGNFSVNHYTRLTPTASGFDVLYVLDFGEAASYEQLADPTPAGQRKWVDGLVFRSSGRPVEPKVVEVQPTIWMGSGMRCLRVTMRLEVPSTGRLEFEDRNLPEQRGWKEITGPGIADRTQALTAYPADVSNPPQDLRAVFDGGRLRTSPAATAEVPAKDTEAPARADFLATLLHSRDLSLWMVLSGLGAAFILGAIHALTPGHGKTMVAAYLVGSHGTARHAALLGITVTVTHTASVFALGLATLFLAQYVMPAKLIHALELISGLSIVMVGGWLLYQRGRHLHQHAHGHAHNHGHHHHHDHGHHHHDHGHSHEMGSLIALGASGGLVPCPSALVLMLGAIAVGRIGFGLLLMVFFSAGLAMVLTAIGLAVICGKHLLPDSAKAAGHGVFRWIPVLSAGVVVCVGLVMTAAAMGWVSLGGSPPRP